MRSSRRPLAIVLLAGAALTSGGCVAVAAGAAAGYGTHKYVANEATREYPADVTRTWHATLAAMRENGYPVAEGVAHGPNGGHVAINDAKVTVEAAGATTSRVRIRLGTFDTASHRQRADAILDGVGRRVGGIHTP